jgi:acyl-ACP thioesterase
MNQKQYSFRLEFSVRDYECDLQGVVNNAVYQHYLEYARHEKQIVHAEVTGVAIRKGRPVSPGNLVSLLGLN